jgi:hypothetical protein
MEVVMTPMCYPAFSKRCKPRDIWEVMLKFVGWSMWQFREGFVGVNMKLSQFNEDVMRKLGFIRTGHEIYRVKGK